MTTEEMAFKSWLDQVDGFLDQETGMDHHRFLNQPFEKWFSEKMSSREAALRVIQLVLSGENNETGDPDE